MIFQSCRVRLVALPDIAKRLTAFYRKNFSMCLKRSAGNGELSLYADSIIYWQTQTGSGFPGAAGHECTPGQAGCSLLKGVEIDNATTHGIVRTGYVLGDGGSSPTIRTFIPLALIRDGADLRAGDFTIRLIRLMFSK